MILPTPRGRRLSAVAETRHLCEYRRDSRTAALTVCWVAALLFTLTGCDEGSSTPMNVPDGFDYSGVCNPPCSPGFTCSDERVCIPDPDTPEPDDMGIGDPMDSSVTVDASEPTDRDADAPTDSGAVADATDVMTTESSDMGIPPDAQTSDACAGEGCESACEDDCALGESVCADEGRVVLNCGQFDPDPCLDWGDRQVCGAQQICMDGECTAQSSCDEVAECVAEERRCGPEGVQQCSEVDGCLLWGPADPCAEGLQCQNGVCVDQSVDECPMIGATACLDELLIECGQFDDDAALDWSAGEPCPNGQSCSGGRCAERAACADECQVDQRRCRGLGVEGCGDTDDDECLEFGGRQACENGESCSYGDCAADCQDECAVGETTCQFGALVICGEFDGDACTDWSLAVACPGDQLCVDLRCQDPADIQPGPQPSPINIITPLAQARVTGTQTVTVEVPRHGHIQDTRIDINGEALLWQDHGGLLSARWDTTTGPDGPATITVQVDRLAQDAWVQTREVIVDNTAPAIVIEAPQANSRHHSPFNFTVRPEDQSGVVDVRFLIDGDEFARTDEPPWTVPIDPAQFQPWGPKTLEVVVHDTVGLMARQSMNVHFEPAQIDLALVSPAMGSPIARPFDFEVQALDETPIDSVSFEIDGQAIGDPVRAAPFRVTIDPANYAGVEHHLEAVARHASGAIGRYTLNVTWDQDAPQAQLLRPAADATITLAQETVTFAFDVVDLDPQVRIRAFIDDEEVAAIEGPPYQLDLATARVTGETHDELIELRFVMSDYLGHTHTTRIPMVFSRADWSMRLPNGETPMIHALSTHDGALVGAFDRAQNRGRVFRVGAAGGPLSFDVSIPGGRPAQLIEFPAQLDVGVIVERDGQHRSYVHIDQGAVAWESAVGHVTDVHPGPRGAVYLIATRPDQAFENQGQLFSFERGGFQRWNFDPRSPFNGGRNESVDWMALADNGTVLVRTVAENGTDHQYYGLNQAGEERWRYEVQSQVAQSALRGDSLIVARHLVDPFDTCPRFSDPECAVRAIEVVSIDVNDGQRQWARGIQPDIEPTQLGFLADGNPFLIGQYVASVIASIDVFNAATGDLVSEQNNRYGSLAPGEAFPTPNGELAVAMSRVWPPDGEAESWGGIYRFSAAGQDIGGYRTIDEVVGDIDGYDGTIAAALSQIGGGSHAVLMLDAAGESVWRTEMEPGFAINRVHMHAPLHTDVRVEERATGRGVILPFDADGTIGWRIDRAGASVSRYAATANELYVTISDDEGLELLRIPRD